MKVFQIQVRGSRPTPGLTLENLSFQCFPNQIQKKQQKIPV